jgi:hypothetical protein
MIEMDSAFGSQTLALVIFIIVHAVDIDDPFVT